MIGASVHRIGALALVAVLLVPAVAAAAKMTPSPVADLDEAVG